MSSDHQRVQLGDSNLQVTNFFLVLLLIKPAACFLEILQFSFTLLVNKMGQPRWLLVQVPLHGILHKSICNLPFFPKATEVWPLLADTVLEYHCCCWSQWCAKCPQFSPQLDKAWWQKDYLVLLWNTTEGLPCIKAYLCCTTSISSELKVTSKQTKEQTLSWQSVHSNWFAFLVHCGFFYEQQLNLMWNKYPCEDTSLALDLSSHPKCCSVTGK